MSTPTATVTITDLAAGLQHLRPYTYPQTLAVAVSKSNNPCAGTIDALPFLLNDVKPLSHLKESDHRKAVYMARQLVMHNGIAEGNDELAEKFLAAVAEVGLYDKFAILTKAIRRRDPTDKELEALVTYCIHPHSDYKIPEMEAVRALVTDHCKDDTKMGNLLGKLARMEKKLKDLAASTMDDDIPF